MYTNARVSVRVSKHSSFHACLNRLCQLQLSKQLARRRKSLWSSWKRWPRRIYWQNNQSWSLESVRAGTEYSGQLPQYLHLLKGFRWACPQKETWKLACDNSAAFNHHSLLWWPLHGLDWLTCCKWRNNTRYRDGHYALGALGPRCNNGFDPLWLCHK